ncbi:modifier protein of major autolysin LytC [Listeria weihenstephanensis FSL R9-0317]|uniref:immunoglobulin-like domain-containing protein n=1 Tax=Listeria weihenstephanensis TaxID=1006155 RepID=UPI0003E8818A|nr:immunoglobulin-like domain-containing protein [Listeria weihenstephanensis]EUJ41035.1 modifier protein of major autolysin LytC [Listeria weihenstephanensis FSL R9-0317]
MSTKKNIIKKTSTIALATVLVGSSLLNTLPVNVFASETALKNAVLAAAPANATEVATFAELKAALLNTSITDIKLTADIKVTTSFNFTTQKSLYGNGHSIDMSFNRIGIAKASSVNRVEDLTITNQNIYPLFWSEYTGVKVTYKDVTSSGQQFVYNSKGTTILEGNIVASANHEEVYQGTTLTIAGGAKVDFTSTSGCPAIRLYGSLTQEANSDLKVNAKDYAIYGHNSNTQISVAGNMDLTSTTEQAIYTAGSGGNMIVKTGAKFKAAAGDLTEEGISITSGNLTVQTGADFVATSPGKQGTVQTGGKLVFENGSNFAITNTNTVGSVFANYAGSSTNININSDKGLSTWDSGRINDALPTHNYNDFTTATLDLSGWDKGNISQKNLTSNSAQFKSQFVSKTTAKLFGGSYAMTNIAQTTIDELTTDSTKATGVAEPNANIVIKDAAGNTLGTGKVGSDGYYSIAIPKQAAGTKVTATATANGITSSATTTVKQAAIAQTTIASLTTDSTTATGTAEPNAAIEIKANGEVIGSGKAGSDGSYSITISQQDVGTRVTATATVGEAASSATTTVTQGDLDQTTISALTTKSTQAEGTAQANAAIQIKNSAGDVLGSGKVGSDGKYSITIPKQAAGTVVTATATSNGKTSTAQTTVVRGEIDTTTINKVTTESTTASGTAEPNATMVINDQDGKQLATGRVGSDGIYSLTIAKQPEGTVVTATATLAGFTSDASTIVERDGIDQTTINPLTTDSTSATGTAEPNATVVIKDQDGKQLATGRVGSDGIYSLTIAKQPEGTVVTATATSNGKTSSANTTVKRDGIEATTIAPLTTDSTVATGTAEPNATVVIKDQDGKQLATGRVGSDGIYSLTIAKQPGGTVVTATATLNGKTSTANTIVKDNRTPAKPIVNPVKDSDTKATGTGTKGDTITVKTPDGAEYTATVGDDGNWSVTIPAQEAGAKLEVTETAPNGNVSPKSEVIVTQTTQTGTITTNDFTIGKDKYIVGTFTGDVKSFRITIGSNVYTGGSIDSAKGTYTFYALDKATAAGTFKIEGLDQYGNVLSTKTANIVKANSDNTPGTGTVTANGFVIHQDKNVTGKVTGDVVSVKLVYNGVTYSGGTVSNGTFSFYGLDKITDKTKAASIEGYDAKGNKIATSQIALTDANDSGSGVGTGTVTANGFVINKDKNVTGTLTGDVVSIRLVYDGVTYTGGSVSNGTFSYYALDKIKDKTKAARIDGYDANGNKIATSAIALTDAKDSGSGVGTGTVKANDFNVGSDTNITGTFTGDVTSIKVRVDNTTYSGGSLASGQFIFYAKDKITNTNQIVFVDGYDRNGNKIATSEVSVAKNLPATSGTITPNMYTIATDRTLTASYTGDVKTVSVTINGTKYTGGTVSGGQVSFYIGTKISSVTDTVVIEGYDAYGRVLQSKVVPLQQTVPVTTGTVTPDKYTTPGDKTLTGTYTGAVKSVIVTINGTEYQGGTVADGKISFWIGDKISKATDVVTIKGLDEKGTVLDTKTVNIVGATAEIGTITPATFSISTSAIKGTYTGAAKTLRVTVNGTALALGGTVADGNFNYYVGLKSKVTSKSDVVKIALLDKNGLVMDEKSVVITD